MRTSGRNSWLAILVVLSVGRIVLADEEFNDPRIKVTVGPSSFASARFDAVVHKLADGSLFVHGNCSADGGKTWTTSPGPVRASFHDEWRQGAGCVLQDGTYIGLGFMPEFPSLTKRILKVYRSNDNLKTITGPTNAILDIPQGTGGRSETGDYHGAVLLDHGLIQRKDGTLLATAYGWWKGDRECSMLEKYVPEMDIYKTRVWVIESKDLGKTWDTLGSPGYWPELGEEGMGEPGLTELANGDLLMVMRNGEWSKPIFQTRSPDGGRTWSKPEKLPATGVWPTPCMMSNGLLILAVGRSKPPNYYLWVSPDGEGKTWTSRTLITTGGKGYASVAEIAPNTLIFSGYNKKERALETWQVKVERAK
jgi:BNR repeat protein